MDTMEGPPVFDEPVEWPDDATEPRYSLVVQVDETVSVVLFTGVLTEVRRRRAELVGAEPRAVVIEPADGSEVRTG
jgi:hypothetical protein